jgi:hypothetical protein
MRPATIEQLLVKARGYQAMDDTIAEWKKRHGGHHPADVERRVQPILRRFDDACAALLPVLRRDFDDVPQVLAIATRLEILLRDVRAETKGSGYFRDPGPGLRGRIAVPWREEIRALLQRAGCTRQRARDLTTAKALRS